MRRLRHIVHRQPMLRAPVRKVGISIEAWRPIRNNIFSSNLKLAYIMQGRLYFLARWYVCHEHYGLTNPGV